MCVLIPSVGPKHLEGLRVFDISLGISWNLFTALGRYKIPVAPANYQSQIVESLRATVNGMPEPVGHNGCLASWGIDGDWVVLF